ncbi:hypothetical protein QBC40DRAFT_267349 [Triangularia verruculosa]|uniref:Rhodopsin domain-containing protein n=1 Tax=Triangularia verruculosa TaxID=2587418 RepID=A0AAN6XCF4_9PEZI|nr:hypothetical protein QBC40DRAFT_267349 [Triangularia verruculosa]
MLSDLDPRGVRLFVLQITFLVLVYIFLSLRILVKSLTVKKISPDDWLIFAAVIVYTAHATITIWGIVSASNQGDIDFKKGENTALHSWFLNEALYAPLSALVRTSIAVFLLRIATSKIHRSIIYVNLACTWTLTVVYFFIVVFQCSPSSYFYNQVLDPSGGSCISKDIVPRTTIAHSIISAITDFILAFLPIAILWDVNLNKRTKAGVATLLGMGLFAGICLIVRIPYVKFIPISDPEFLEQTNGTAFWSVMETSLGIIAGCAATLRPLMRGFGPRRTPWRQGSKYSNTASRSRSKKSRPPPPPPGAAPNQANTNPLVQSQNLREVKDDYPLPYQPISPDDIYSPVNLPNDTQIREPDSPDFELAMQMPDPDPYPMPSNRTRYLNHYDHRNSHYYESRTAGRLWDKKRTPSSNSIYSCISGGVRIKTSIEITRETQSPEGRETPQDSLNFPLQGGQVVTINGPSGPRR